MPKEDFLDLFDLGKDKDTDADEESTLATVIKNNELKVGGGREMLGENKVVENDSFVLKLYKKDGVVDSIEIKCRCGRTAKVQLEYQNSSARDDEFDHLETPADQNISSQNDTVIQGVSHTDQEPVHKEHETQTGQENEEFQEGIAAPVISPKASQDVSQIADMTENTSEQ